eukprot:Blabericola_migrator_1__13455@NODE_96_length_14432_cov_203_974173_g86_i0_p2_GENE_NODE_96_length_14432_cov_203_974173_g86_i0NODE_96_length_14432_cov_203_974173_g86_i0_p2_ORF_typecomplete_len663_score175_69ATPase_2/PF01637_18/0_0047PWI/PF01480_17/1_3e04PWI/PF01480_17/1_1PWI/PF01480_17/2_5e03_NODE_96_length_14432_cov_203_974173_g86_i0939411382
MGAHVLVSDDLWLQTLGFIGSGGGGSAAQCRCGRETTEGDEVIERITHELCVKQPHLTACVYVVRKYVALLYYGVAWSPVEGEADIETLIKKTLTRVLDSGIPAYVLKDNERLFAIADAILLQAINYHSPWLAQCLNLCEISLTRHVLKPMFTLEIEGMCDRALMRLLKLQTMSSTGCGLILFLLAGFLKSGDQLLECTSLGDFQRWFANWLPNDLMQHVEPNDMRVLDQIWNDAKVLAKFTPKTYSELFDICLMGADKLSEDTQNYGRVENVLTDIVIPSMDAAEFISILLRRAEIKTWIRAQAGAYTLTSPDQSTSPQPSSALPDDAVRSRLRVGIELQSSLTADNLQESLELQCQDFLRSTEIVVIDGRDFESTACPFKLKAGVQLKSSASKELGKFLDNLESVRGKCIAFVDEAPGIKRDSYTGEIITACLERSVSKMFVISGGFQSLYSEIHKLPVKFHQQLLVPIQRWNIQQRLSQLVEDVQPDQIKDSVKGFLEKEGEVFAQATDVVRKRFRSFFVKTDTPPPPPPPPLDQQPDQTYVQTDLQSTHDQTTDIALEDVPEGDQESVSRGVSHSSPPPDFHTCQPITPLIPELDDTLELRSCNSESPSPKAKETPETDGWDDTLLLDNDDDEDDKMMRELEAELEREAEARVKKTPC